MKLLITGGCGFLGSNLAVDALERGDELMLFDNLDRSGSMENLDWLQNQGDFAFVGGSDRVGDVDDLRGYCNLMLMIFGSC